jgi:hypothetical protein
MYPVRADMGSLPLNPNAVIFEPHQNAFIAWNGFEEILLLSTILESSEETKIMEVIPLPNEPEVKKGDMSIFRKAVNFINKRNQVHKKKSLYAKLGGNNPYALSAGKITQYKTIGAHNISVAKVMDSRYFVKWVKKYLKELNSGNPKISRQLQKVVEQYLDEGFQWFVFDVVELKKSPFVHQAIQYRFKTDKLFYPLKISSTETGPTQIDLLVLTSRLLNNFPQFPEKRIKLMHNPAVLSKKEIKSLSPEIYDLMELKITSSLSFNQKIRFLLNKKNNSNDNPKLRIWRIRGDLKEFTNDLVAY